MPALHLVFQPGSLQDCLTLAKPEDEVLLLGSATALAQEPLPRTLWVLADDLVSAGGPSIVADAEPVDYPGFVDLVVNCQPIVSWR